MSAANVRNIQALADLKAALARFKSDALEPIHAAQQEIQRAQEWLAERERHWQREVQRCEEIVRQTQAALARCQASGYYDKQGRYYPPNCSAQERALAHAQQQLERTRAELQNARQWARAVEQAAAEFQREQQRLTNMLNNDAAKALALLERKIAILQGYVGDSAPSTSASSLSESITSAPSASSPITWAEQRAIWQRVDAGEPITLEELKRASQLPSDLETGTVAKDESWLRGILASEGYWEAMRDSREATDLRDALLATLKAINYWRSKS